MAFEFEPMSPLTFESVKSCIYCGDRAGRLSEEHIIPYGLGGRLKLPAASCASCADETSGFERRLLRSGNWWPLRRALDLASRRARQQPQSFPATIDTSGVARVLDVKVANGPLAVVVFDFDPPTQLTGRPTPDSDRSSLSAPRLLAWDVRGFVASGGVEVHLSGSGLFSARTDVTVAVDMSVHDFGRLVAKIALGWAIGRFGVDAFEEFYVQRMILGADNTEPARWVGACGLTLPLEGRGLHSLADVIIDGDVVVYLQLFRPPPTWPQPPTYQVVVGKLRS